MPTASADQIRGDFDRIAHLTSPEWNHNTHHHRFLLSHLPAQCAEVVDVGCGKGDFARLLAARASSVVGIDLSPEMVRLARDASAGIANIRYVVDDFMAIPIAERSVDAVVSIATLHHTDFEAALRRLGRWLKPGGRLIVLDLFASGYGLDLAWKLPAMAMSGIYEIARNRRVRRSREARQVWDQHARTDQFMSLRKIRSVAAATLPGSVIRQHLLWRYSLVWTKPVE